MTEKQRSNNKQPPWQREADTEAVPFGPWLRRQREMREITLREISDASKISLRYLQALEDERFDLLPAMVFAKGFLRQYARYVGLDQDEVVNRFLIASRDEVEEDEEPESDEAAGAGSPRALDGAWKYAVLIVVVVIVLLALVFLLPRLLGGRDRSARITTPPPAATAPPGEAAAAGSPGVAGKPGATPATGAPATATNGVGTVPVRPDAEAAGEAPLRVTLDFREDCWVEATVDGARRVSEMRVQGESLQLQAQQSVELRLGNAGVVDIEVNGRPYPLQATPGQVRQVRIDLSDLSGGPPSAAADARAEGSTAPPGTIVPSQP